MVYGCAAPKVLTEQSPGLRNPPTGDAALRLVSALSTPDSATTRACTLWLSAEVA
jgi:hypothetical protein